MNIKNFAGPKEANSKGWGSEFHTFYLSIRLKYFLRLPNLLQYENVTQWEWWVFLKNLEDLPLTNMNWYLAEHALTMLGLCYLPGCLAGYIQLFRGTKYSKFPKFLDRWLKMRKQLGLLMLLSASLHVISLFQFQNLLSRKNLSKNQILNLNLYHFQI